MGRQEREHPAVVRLCHWLSAVSVAILAASGLQIFAAFPTFGDKTPQVDLFEPPEFIRLGGWLGGALQWHLPFAWLFLATGAAYLVYEASSGNYRQVLISRFDWPGIWPMARHYFFFGPKPAQSETYNPLQKLAYTTAIGAGAVLGITGLGLYKPVQLSWLAAGPGGIRMLRLWHFAAMGVLLAFIPGHLVMVALHGWGNFTSMWTGGRSCSADRSRS